MLLRRAEAQRERFGGDHYMVNPLDLAVLLDVIHELLLWPTA
jgi:hypothetical protein